MFDWLERNCMVFKCKQMVISRKQKPLPHNHLKLSNNILERVYTYKYLGVRITSDLSQSHHIYAKCCKARKLIGLLRQFQGKTDPATLFNLHVYRSFMSTPGICIRSSESLPAESYPRSDNLFWLFNLIMTLLSLQLNISLHIQLCEAILGELYCNLPLFLRCDYGCHRNQKRLLSIFVDYNLCFI